MVKRNHEIGTWCAVIVTTLWMGLGCANINVNHYNYFVLFSCFAIYGLAYMIGSALKLKMHFHVPKTISRIIIGIWIGAFLGIIYWAILKSNHEDRIISFYYNAIMKRSSFAGVIFCFIIILLLGFHLLKKKKMTRSIGMLIFSLLGGISHLYLNLLAADSYHGEAYITSIYNLLKGYSYSPENKSIYGHYGFFYELPVRLLGLFTNSYQAILITIMLVSMVAFLLFSITLDRIITSDIVYYLVLIAGLTAVTALTANNYFQVWPHRIFPLILFLFLMSDSDKPNGKKQFLLFAMVLAMIQVWNLEMGIVCSIAWLVCKEIIFIRNNGIGIKSVLISTIRGLTLLGAVFVLGYVLASLFNILHGGGRIYFSDYLFPYVGANQFVDFLYVKIAPFPDVWVIAILILSWGFWGTFCDLLEVKGSIDLNKKIILLATAIIGFGAGMYYFNRATGSNLDIVLWPVLIILGYMVDQSIVRPQQNTIININELSGKLYSSSGLILIFLLIIILVFKAPQFLAYKYQSNIWDTTQVEEASNWIMRYCDEDDSSLLVGRGSVSIAAIQDAEIGYHGTDYEDVILNSTAIQYLEKTAEASSTIVISILDRKMVSLPTKNPIFLSDCFELYSTDVNVCEKIRKDREDPEIGPVIRKMELASETYASYKERIEAVVGAYTGEYDKDALDKIIETSFYPEHKNFQLIYDYLKDIAPLESLPEDAFVNSCYVAMFQRNATPEEIAEYTGYLTGKEKTRCDVFCALAESDAFLDMY